MLTYSWLSDGALHTHKNRFNSCLLVRFSVLEFIYVRFSFLGLLFVIVYMRVCAFVVLDLVSSVPFQEIGWKECLQNDLCCVVRDVKP